MVKVIEPSQELIRAIDDGTIDGDIYADGDVYVNMQTLPEPWRSTVTIDG